MDAEECVRFVQCVHELHGFVKSAAIEFCDLLNRACSSRVVREGRVPVAAFEDLVARAHRLSRAMAHMNTIGTEEFGLPLYYTVEQTSDGLLDKVFTDEKFLPASATADQVEAISRQRQNLILTLGQEHTTCLELLAMIAVGESVALGLDSLRAACADRATAERVAIEHDARGCAAEEARRGAGGDAHPMFDRDFLLVLGESTRSANEASAAARRASIAAGLAQAVDIFNNLLTMAKQFLSEGASNALGDMITLAGILAIPYNEAAAAAAA